MELQEALKTFFAMDESGLVNFIKHQKAKFKFGALG
jgi:hypothetical protein